MATQFTDPRITKPLQDRLVGEALQALAEGGGGVELPIEISDVTGLQDALDSKGTSNLAIGTTATTAAAGNHNHAIAADTDSGLTAAANLQAAFIALSARIKALEDAE